MDNGLLFDVDPLEQQIEPGRERDRICDRDS